MAVIVEKSFSGKIHSWGEVPSAACTFLVILSKTLIPLALLWKISTLNPGCLGWVNNGLFQALWKGVALSVVMMVFAGLYQKYSYLLFGSPYASTGGSMLQDKTSGLAIGLLMSAALLNAFGEEIMFRGMLLPALSGNWSIGIAVIAQSLIFTVYHFFPLQNSVLLFFMGIFFALGYLWSGSLLTPVIAHLIENGTGVAIYLIRLLTKS
jgi:hypothetical protein